MLLLHFVLQGRRLWRYLLINSVYTFSLNCLNFSYISLYDQMKEDNLTA